MAAAGSCVCVLNGTNGNCVISSTARYRGTFSTRPTAGENSIRFTGALAVFKYLAEETAMPTQYNISN